MLNTWADPGRPTGERVAALLAELTLEEKLAQLVGVWVGISDGEEVAPAQHEFAEPLPPWDELTKPGLGQLTRVFGTGPVDPLVGAKVLAETQRKLVANTRFGIPAMAHEECLAGFTAWQATVFPVPLAWGASFDPESVERMAREVGLVMRDVGVHQGLAPVLDVTRDPRWGRTEETIGEDPYLVGLLGAAYTKGLESSGIVATLKHFAGYSASAGGRNHAPVHMGPREFADVVLPPFEMALRLGGARSVMHSYAEVDGVPPAADPSLLTDLLRDQWGFDGVVVADYFGVSFLETAHGVAGSPGEAGAMALAAGVDVELPSVRCYGEPLTELVRSGLVDEALVDRAVTRVLTQKCELGLLDEDYRPESPAVLRGEPVDLDPPALRDLARTMAERSVVLLDNASGVLPLDPAKGDTVKLAVVGPCADDLLALMGCYAFPNHVGVQHPEVALGVEMDTLLQAVRTEFPDAAVSTAKGCEVDGEDRSGIADAVAVAREADVVLAVLGDRAGLFGRGTSGEGCDAEDLSLPGVQGELLDALLALDVPVVLVLLTGRPYALGSYQPAAVVQAFFPGEEGAGAVAGVLSGRVNPSGKLPVQVPRGSGGQPTTYLHPRLGGPGGASSVDPSPAYPFGHGLSYTTFELSDFTAGEEFPSDGEVEVSCLVRNTGDRPGAEVVQLYLHDPVASVTRPVRQLVGFARVDLEPGEATEVGFRLHADRTSFTGRDGRRVVEPGELLLQVGCSSADIRWERSVRLTGEPRVVGHDRVLVTPVSTN
ncbi:glycosyl hydrolase [Saccharothrix sp. ALI-22-I]|uniref:beta-xylosidase/alpha-l-arabinosidase n=1 Tax=Saccharothrix sp. ALI-22-I TaxID=1933778 RepID=UPI00097BB69F|nr:glycoside hydrolase family 3 N-terminal domain-containing protein [Saccharothrix sp. ALI-22-I]ONI80490.1 glycosyl hydrolase [Saccharothrix sp. ALI-22-I]